MTHSRARHVPPSPPRARGVARPRARARSPAWRVCLSLSKLAKHRLEEEALGPSQIRLCPALLTSTSTATLTPAATSATSATSAIAGD